VRTHPLWNPFETPSEEDINAARVQLGVWVPAPVEVVAADPAWPQWYAAARDRVFAALGERVLAIEHVGSTAVPGLWAKPMIDVDLVAGELRCLDGCHRRRPERWPGDVAEEQVPVHSWEGCQASR